VAADVAGFRADLLAGPRNRGRVLVDVADMRARLAAARAPEGPLDARRGPGRLLDLDLLVQTGALLAGSPATDPADQLAAGVGTGWLGPDEAATLGAAQALLWKLQGATRLLTDGPLDPATVGQGGMAFLLRETGASDAPALMAETARLSAAAAAVADRVLAPGPGAA
jgi:glutamate-ammonia-ligase adenylyltransferase